MMQMDEMVLRFAACFLIVLLRILNTCSQLRKLINCGFSFGEGSSVCVM